MRVFKHFWEHFGPTYITLTCGGNTSNSNTLTDRNSQICARLITYRVVKGETKVLLSESLLYYVENILFAADLDLTIFFLVFSLLFFLSGLLVRHVFSSAIQPMLSLENTSQQCKYCYFLIWG